MSEKKKPHTAYYQNMEFGWAEWGADGSERVNAQCLPYGYGFIMRLIIVCMLFSHAICSFFISTDQSGVESSRISNEVTESLPAHARSSSHKNHFNQSQSIDGEKNVLIVLARNKWYLLHSSMSCIHNFRMQKRMGKKQACYNSQLHDLSY